ncbi:nicotinate-nucleotide--dimethylbenzimidazole phosphoribosyltransferase [Streptomyces fumigatiscleroticus]|nr:nicotinate-nucleotide--dimethylbenzimidazole phosphoribosyltransferase [Streptomyces fumigatiscleroticus]
MTDTGQIPGEGLPENAGMVEQPGVTAHGAYTYLSETAAEDEDLLLPGAQGAWGNEVAPPAPEPVVEAVHEPAPEATHEPGPHEPGPHEVSGRDSGSVDLGAVRPAGPAPVPPAAPAAPRRPLHLGPPIPDTSASPVRSLADRGPADAPVRQPVAPAAGPEYLDVPPGRDVSPQGAAPWGAQAAAQPPVSPGAAPAETVAPDPEPAGAAEAVVARVATEAVTATEAVAAATDAVAAAETVSAAEAVTAGEAVAAATGAVVAAEAVAGTEAVAAAAGQFAGAPVAGQPADPAAGTAAQPAEGGIPEAEQPAGAPVELPAAGQVADDPEAGAVPEAGGAPEAGQAPVAETDPEAGQGTEIGQVTEIGQGTEIGHGPVAGYGPEAGAVPDAGAAFAADAPQGPATVSSPSSEGGQLVGTAQFPDAEQFADAGQLPEEVPQAPETPGGAQPQPAEVAPAQGESGTEPLLFPNAPVSVEPAQYPDGSEAPEAPVTAAGTPAAQTDGEAAVPDPQQTEADPLVPDAPVRDVETPGNEPSARETVPAAVPVAEAEHTPTPPEDAAADAAGVQDGQGDTGGPHPGAAGPQPDQQVGQFLPVDGQVPAASHPVPAPPQAAPLPQEEQAPEPLATVPAPRGADPAPAPAAETDPELVQHADDLDTRGADQEEESTAPVAEARQSTGPAAPAYDDAEREAVLKVMRERRDIRNGFRSDPIPHEVLLRVLEAAHTAPSVGHSQPWDFVVIRSAETRRAMHELAMRQRDAYAKSLPKGRAKQFKELKIEAILDTPVNIVVTADPTRGGRHTLGRHTQPQMAPYSSALAVENLWLAARAEGLGVGWVSFFDEREMVRALGLPEHLEVVAYLCVGYVDEFPDEPELMQAGWSKRRPLSWVVHEETYGRRALPGEDPHDLLAETVAQIRPLDAKALGEAWERQKRMTKPAGALGMLEIISAQLSGLSRQCPPPIPEPAAVAIFAGDHGVHAQGVTPWPQEVTGQMVANFLGGGAVCNAFAAQVGAEVCVVDVGVAADLPATPGLLPRKIRGGTSDMTTGPAMTREEAKKAIEVGIETARDLVAAGNKALLTGEMGIANTTASAALISVFTGADPAEVTGRGTGINDETLARKTEVVRRAIELHQPDPADPIGVLAAVGGFEHAAMVGLLLGGASLRTPVILDGVSAGAAALVARAIAPEVLAACIAGHRSAEPGHVAALNKLGLRPLVDLDLRLGEGTGALLALPMVQSTARAMHEVATFDSAGVTEK